VLALREERLATLLNHPRLLSKRDELAWSALHGFIVRAACSREIGRYSDHFLDAPICVIPKLDAKWKVIVASGHRPCENGTRTLSIAFVQASAVFCRENELHEEKAHKGKTS
jgi:hypothetical protein